jgi:hypothetical protein
MTLIGAIDWSVLVRIVAASTFGLEVLWAEETAAKAV